MRCFGLLAALLLAACSPSATPPDSLPASSRAATSAVAISHEAYVWQRVWTDELRQRVATETTAFSGLRVLMLQVDPAHAPVVAGVDAAVLAASGQPVTAVVRIDGQGDLPDVTAFGERIVAGLRHWQSSGVNVAAVEIDYDCATSKLPGYARFLHALRGQLPAATRLSITALPAWLDGAGLDDVIAAVDEPVLQVHAVVDPTGGLFDPGRAETWARRFSSVAKQGFRIALPAYGARLRLDDQGRALAVASEMTVDLAGTDDARELVAEPADVLGLLKRLQRDPPPGWRGVAWFRLPLDSDRRAWSLAALRAVIAGRLPRADLHVEANANANGSIDIVLHNRGEAALGLPAIELDARCSSGDALAGYRLDRTPATLRLSPQVTDTLAAGRRRAIGWLRCPGEPAPARLSSDPSP